MWHHAAGSSAPMDAMRSLSMPNIRTRPQAEQFGTTRVCKKHVAETVSVSSSQNSAKPALSKWTYEMLENSSCQPFESKYMWVCLFLRVHLLGGFT